MSSELDLLSELDIEVENIKKEMAFDRGTYALIKKKRKPVVLAVDDKPDILNSLKTILYMDCHFVGVPSGAAALDYLQKHEAPDLYIFDIEMPNMNGFELAKHIQRMGKKTIYMFLTSNSDRGALREAINCGATDFIVKPCRKKVILQKFYGIFGE